MTDQGYHVDNARFMCATQLTDGAGALVKEGPASIVVHSQREERGEAEELLNAVIHLHSQAASTG